MKREFIVKMQGKQFEKGRARLVVMLFCFVLAMVILMIYSYRFSIAFLAPIFWLILRLKTLSDEKHYMTDVICEAVPFEGGMEMELKSSQPKLCGRYRIEYAKTRRFTVGDDGQVLLEFSMDQGKAGRMCRLQFYPMADDLDFWKEEQKKCVPDFGDPNSGRQTSD